MEGAQYPYYDELLILDNSASIQYTTDIKRF